MVEVGEESGGEVWLVGLNCQVAFEFAANDIRGGEEGGDERVLDWLLMLLLWDNWNLLDHDGGLNGGSLWNVLGDLLRRVKEGVEVEWCVLVMNLSRRS